jgi:diguanylate cyclase (GGDEF)-like protein
VKLMPTTYRTALAAGAAIVATLLPTAPASAADGPAATSDAVSGLASDAARLLAEERDLIVAADGDTTGRVWDQLAAVDARGADTLADLDRLGVDVSPSIRAALGTTAVVPDIVVLDGSVYDAAIAGLGRIAATPDAALPDPAPSDEPTSDLLLVAISALVLLGFAARSASIGAHETLASTVWSDELTGIANRRRLDHDLALGGDPALGPTSVIMVDVDHFETVNDRFGHQAGDDVLRQLTHLISANVRDHDVVYRYGGEEFCVLLVGATAGDARQIADRLLDAVRTIELPDGDHVTVSVGVAAGEPETVIDTLAVADRALLEAKTGGRDRVCIADQLQHV